LEGVARDHEQPLTESPRRSSLDATYIVSLISAFSNWMIGELISWRQQGQIIGALSLFLWFGVLYFGRMLPYFGNSF